MIWYMLALAVAAAPTPERLNCAWPAGAGKPEIVVFQVSPSSIEPVSEGNLFKNTWRLVQNNKSSLVATSAVEGSGDASPLTLFVTTLVLNRRSQDAAVTTTEFVQGRPQPSTTVMGTCRSLPR
jgi:hypothetical protein